MSRVCEICGKGRLIGNHIETRGKAKYLGGVGTKITGITRRSFLPNLQNVRTTTENGITKTLRVCTQCIRSGAIRKQVRNAPFKLAHELEAAAAGKRIGVKRNKKTTTKTNNNNNNNNKSKNTTKK
ncbi:MAG: 50S ribosomal protein L28 [Planctomycetaceae bacterium]|jgi:large subunit ribosomal protein L28|nr:50S ribosomal protein L28 [Planctomycetaceae bacterium]